MLFQMGVHGLSARLQWFNRFEALQELNDKSVLNRGGLSHQWRLVALTTSQTHVSCSRMIGPISVVQV